MFFDTSLQETFVIDRVSSAGKELRRVMVLAEDGSITVCKPNGVVTRLFHCNSITHLVHAAVDGVSAKMVLLRVQREHDLLFTHSSPTEGGVSHPYRLIDKIEQLRVEAFGGAPLNTVERRDPALLRDAANLEKPAGFCKPVASPMPNQVLLPLLFDEFPIPVGPEVGTICEETDIIVDGSFITMLQKSMASHPLSAHQNPKVLVEAPAPFQSLEVSAKFLSGFCLAYEREVPLVMTLHSHLPTITTFRASKRFWDFIQRMLRVSRPNQSVLATLSDAHIEVSPISEQSSPICVTLKEWNDTIIQWEISVRAPQAQKKRTTAPGPSEVFWGAFVDELQTLMGSERAKEHNLA